MQLNGFDTEKSFEYENSYFATATHERFGKFLAQYEIYKKIINLPGAIVECGLLKGNSFFSFAHFREILETRNSRKIIGFDIFGEFPETNFSKDSNWREKFISEVGNSIEEQEAHKILAYKDIKNYELIKGDICQTLPEYVSNHPELKIALLHIDVDIYEPTKVILENMYEQVIGGGGDIIR